MQHFATRIFSVINNFGQFRLEGHSQMFGVVDFQLCGIFDQLNALPGLLNEPKNEPCATRNLPGPLKPATAQRRPRFLHRRIFARVGLRGRFEITLKSEFECNRLKKRQPHAAPSTWESGGTSVTYPLVPQSTGRHLDYTGAFMRGHIDIFD